MKKLVNTSFIYAITAILSGVFYREYTKIMGFTERTTLSLTHLHLFVLGTIVCLILALFCMQSDLWEQKRFRLFWKLYNIGLPFMVLMLYVRGIVQVMGIELSRGADAAISGIAGIAHIIMTISIVLLFLCLKNITFLKEKE